MLYFFSLYICILMYNRFSMKRLYGILLVVTTLFCTSCEDILQSLNVKQDLNMPMLEFRLDRQQQKDGGEDLLMDETISFNLDSLMTEWGYSSLALSEYLEKSMLKKISFQLKDTAGVKDFDFVDSARMTFCTASVAEETVARLSSKEERKAASMLELQLALSDVTRFIQSKEQIRVRIYGNADMDKLPSEVPYVDVQVTGDIHMELKPKL